MYLDINCDLGESFGVYTYGADTEMMPLITSANIACGAHGGDPAVMRESVDLALSHGVSIGAHVGLEDRQGFGRREIPTTAAQVYDLCLYQIGALDAFVRAAGATMAHLKPHGALYMMANRDPDLADAVRRAVISWNPELLLYALPESELHRCATAAGIRVVPEVFADRPYDGTEVRMYDRGPDLIGGADDVIVRTLAQLDGPYREHIRTVCLHSDTVGAPMLLRALRTALTDAGFIFAAPTAHLDDEVIDGPANTSLIQKGLV